MVDQARTARIEGDDAAAEHIFRQVLDRQPDHGEAGTSLASMLIDRGDVEDALIILGKLTPDTEVDRLQSAARLRASSGDDLSELEARVEELAAWRRKRVVVHCAMGGRSARACVLLREKGFSDLINLAGGLEAWVREFGSASATPGAVHRPNMRAARHESSRHAARPSRTARLPPRRDARRRAHG